MVEDAKSSSSTIKGVQVSSGKSRNCQSVSLDIRQEYRDPNTTEYFQSLTLAMRDRLNEHGG